MHLVGLLLHLPIPFRPDQRFYQRSRIESQLKVPELQPQRSKRIGQGPGLCCCHPRIQ
ncbi:hypothetical protein HanXRQr2_Chr03g0103281 [Helianthus annuus]|uniref:Uncharacterized protein n=1 Tax=Helianthus annuus TaxID=4232 RepID=A0A9K3JE76_HELAN|nr:hypothetical protein HanXRQr2_Chr03g0103281 [Helianthus annuus]KAJ0943082.1 hypothetical protein HanPSC8_Chr03g0099771 [Helianthus annuus]